MWRAIAVAIGAAGLSIAPAPVQSVPSGRVIDELKCAGDPRQSYALYLPAGYDQSRRWSLLMAFHPSANGRAMVEKYRAAAEQYGYIVAASNNSRNGPSNVSADAIAAMSTDVTTRFSIDDRRLYLTGMSGGSRLALQVALTNRAVAGVIASSAGFLDNQPRASLTFAVFGTAGTEDINHLEMRLLDRALETPHRLAIFDGGHTLPPDDVALQAIEWMELQAVKSGRRTRDDALIDRWYAARRAAADALPDSADTLRVLNDFVDDFRGLRDVTAAATAASRLARLAVVKKALANERADDDAEFSALDEIWSLERSLQNPDRRAQDLLRLRERLAALSRQATAASDSTERRRARRLLGQLTMGATDRVTDPDYLALLRQYRLAATGRGGDTSAIAGPGPLFRVTQ